MFKGFFRIDKSYWLLVPMILHATIPWFQWRIRIWYVFAFVILWLFVNFGRIISCLGLSFSRYARSFLLWYFLFYMIGYVYACFGHGDFLGWGKVSLVVNQCAFYIVVHYTLTRRKFSELRFMVFLVILGLCVAGLMGLRGAGVEGLEGARNFVGGEKALGSVSSEHQFMAMGIGLGDYRYVYMCAWFFPLFLITMTLAKDNRIKIFMAVAAALLVVSMKTSGLGTVAALFVISGLMYCSWLLSRRSRIALKIMGFSLVVMFFLYATVPSVFGFLVTPLTAIGQSMGEGSVKERITQVTNAFAGYTYGNYAYERAQLQLVSISGFLKKPIFGNGLYEIDFVGGRPDISGGHSMILDSLSHFGIVGFVPLTLMLIALGRYYIWMAKTFFYQECLALPTVFIIMFVFSSIANPTFGIPHMAFILIPGLCYIIAASNKKFIPMSVITKNTLCFVCP